MEVREAQPQIERWWDCVLQWTFLAVDEPSRPLEKDVDEALTGIALNLLVAEGYSAVEAATSLRDREHVIECWFISGRDQFMVEIVFANGRVLSTYWPPEDA